MPQIKRTAAKGPHPHLHRFSWLLGRGIRVYLEDVCPWLPRLVCHTGRVGRFELELMTLNLAFQGTWDDVISEPCCQSPAKSSRCVDFAAWL